MRNILGSPSDCSFTILSLMIGCLWPVISECQSFNETHRAPAAGEIPVRTSGCFDKPGTTYILVNDIRSPKSAVFLGKDVTLDLNGFTITYADGGYEHIPNGSFEEGLKNWDISKAPSAKVEDKKVHVFIGNHVLRLAAGEEITSEYIDLPVAVRSYFAFCGVTGQDMRISVFVEDSKQNSLLCKTEYADSARVSCPLLNRSPRMGGGFVYAHITGLPAGKYRVRIKAETDCLIDYIDIRPAMDVGIGIIGNTHPLGHYDNLYKRVHSAFFDYTANVKQQDPLPGMPQVKGKGSVTIKNGLIRNASPGILSWGIQSTAEDVYIILDSLIIEASGINSTAVDVPQAVISHCKFDVDNPFIINRHGAEFYAVDLRGDKPSEVSFSEFYGGQGCLSFKGDFSKVHHNFFANRQTVTNHYSIMAMGDSSLIYDNLIDPEIGSGIEIYVHRGIEIFRNTICIEASPPTCEYGHEDYSTTAIRIADYNALPGAPDGCFGNKVYNNKFYITGKDYPEYTDYIPMAWAVFYSASAGDNYIFGNEIEVNDLSPGSKNETSAFYIGGGTIGGEFYGNLITTNVPAAWVASRYGPARSTRIYDNRIIKSTSATTDFKPFRMGWTGWKGCVADSISFKSNEVTGASFDVDATDQPHTYSVWWTLTVHATGKDGKPVAGREIKIFDRNGTMVKDLITAQNGTVAVSLREYSFSDQKKDYDSPYIILERKTRLTVDLDHDKDVIIQVK